MRYMVTVVMCILFWVSLTLIMPLALLVLLVMFPLCVYSIGAVCGHY